MSYSVVKLCFLIIFASTNMKHTSASPHHSEISNLDEHDGPITLDKIKNLLKDYGIFDEASVKLTQKEKTELNDLWEYVTVAMTSRTRQPPKPQNKISTLRAVEAIVKQQISGTISSSLANKFQWAYLEPTKSTHENERQNYV